MYKYWRHLGDYAKATGHLSMLEHGAYTVLLDLAYDSEGALPGDESQLFRRLRARTAAEKAAVRSVLSEFWILAPGGWVNERVQREIAEYQQKSEKTRGAAVKRWHGERNADADADALHGASEGNASRARSDNQQPATNNQSTRKAALSGELELAGSSMPQTPEADARSTTVTRKPVAAAKKKEGAGRERNPLFDFMAELTGTALDQVTAPLAGEIGRALKVIRQVCPELTVEELRSRAGAYRAKWPDITLSPSALAKHWGSLEVPRKKEGGGVPGWDWQRFAIEGLGMNGVLPWADLLDRVRDYIVDEYEKLPPDEKKKWGTGSKPRTECQPPSDWREIWAEVYGPLPCPATWDGVLDVARRRIIALSEQKKRKGGGE